MYVHDVFSLIWNYVRYLSYNFYGISPNLQGEMPHPLHVEQNEEHGGYMV